HRVLRLRRFQRRGADAVPVAQRRQRAHRRCGAEGGAGTGRAVGDARGLVAARRGRLVARRGPRQRRAAGIGRSAHCHPGLCLRRCGLGRRAVRPFRRPPRPDAVRAGRHALLPVARPCSTRPACALALRAWRPRPPGRVQPRRPQVLARGQRAAGGCPQRQRRPLHRAWTPPCRQRVAGVVIPRPPAPFPPITPGVRSMKPYASAVVLILVLFAAGLARAQAGKDRDPGRDRDAILGMQGEYLVDFAFDETVLLAPGYERAPAQRSGGDEVVIVVEDTPARIVLQHILVDPGSGHVTKHWRQDWTYEATRRWEFVAYQTWRLRDIPAEKSSGAWTQCVYEVSDAPRYCGTGRWNHRYGVSTWTSDRSWRPLPRREYTRRDDYNAMNVQNRHTVVPGGWTHEQDNTKTVRRADGSTERTIARESGFNDYQKATDVDFAPAYAYWNATRDYWARVRA